MARLARHARKKNDYGSSQPARSAQLAVAVTEPEKRAPSRKDPEWCKTARGPHVRVTVFFSHFPRVTACRWQTWYTRNDNERKLDWLCHHRQVCEACGKVLRFMLSDGECPDYDGVTGYDEALAEAEKNRERRQAMFSDRQKPVIDGRQGYRRQKSVPSG